MSASSFFLHAYVASRGSEAGHLKNEGIFWLLFLAFRRSSEPQVVVLNGRVWGCVSVPHPSMHTAQKFSWWDRTPVGVTYHVVSLFLFAPP